MADIFNLLTSSECEVEETLVGTRRRYPTRGYLVVVSDECAAEVKSDSSCLRDDCFKELFATYPDIRGVIPQARVRFKVKMEKRCMLRIESLHASFRRRVKIREVQHRGGDFVELCAD